MGNTLPEGSPRAPVLKPCCSSRGARSPEEAFGSAPDEGGNPQAAGRRHRNPMMIIAMDRVVPMTNPACILQGGLETLSAPSIIGLQSQC